MRRFAWAAALLAFGVSPPAHAAWSPDFGAGNLGTNGNAWVFAEYGGDLVIGGSFFGAGPLTACGNVAKFDGAAWTGRLKRGTNGPVTALGVHGGLLYAGGLFTQAGLGQLGGPANVLNLAAWDGSVWSDVGGGLNDNPVVLAEWNGNLLAAGFFTQAGAVSARRIATWDGAMWAPLGAGLGAAALSSERVKAVVIWNGELWAGGTFSEIDGTPVTGLAKWDGVSWTDGGVTVTPGTHIHAEGIETLAVYDGALIVGGDIAAMNGVPVNGLARFDGSVWSDLGGTFSSGAAVGDLVLYHNDLVAIDGLVLGGCLEIARWDGAAWSAFGAGIQHFDLFGAPIRGAVFQGSLMVGGDIAVTGPYAASFLGRWTDPGTDVSAEAGGDSGFRVFPNPARTGASVRFALAAEDAVRLEVLDLRGRRVAGLLDGRRAAGSHAVVWDGRSDAGVPVAAGVYFVRIRTGGRVQTEKLILNR